MFLCRKLGHLFVNFLFKQMTTSIYKRGPKEYALSDPAKSHRAKPNE